MALLPSIDQIRHDIQRENKKIQTNLFSSTKQNTNTVQTVYYTDGYCSRNGNTNAFGGVTVFKNGGLFITRRLDKRGVTSNECELEALAIAVRDANQGDEIVVDSMNSIYWVRSGKPKARMDLQPLCLELKQLIREKSLDVYWLPRSENLAGIYNEQSFRL